MTNSRLSEILRGFCAAVGIPPTDVVRRRLVFVRGIEVIFSELGDDTDHYVAIFRFGTVFAGRSLRVFRLMLEANLLVYARGDAVMAMDPDTGGVVLSIRASYEITDAGQWLANTLAHFAEHALYWKTNILECPDEMFSGIASGESQWIRA